MGASASTIKAAEQPAAESLLTAFKTLSGAERRRHASVLNYWLSVRGDKEFPPLHDLDPLELSDAGPSSILLELISGGHDAEIRHLGEALRDEAWPERIIDAPNPSVLSCIAKKLPIVAISRDFLAFEDEYETASGKTRCSVTLLPLSAGGAWVDYVYALVSVDQEAAKAKTSEKKAKASQTQAEQEDELPDVAGDDPQAPQDEVRLERGKETDTGDDEALPPEASVEAAGESAAFNDEPLAKQQEPIEAFDEVEADDDEESGHLAEDSLDASETMEPEAATSEDPVAPEGVAEQLEPEPVRSPAAKAAPGFSKLLDSLAGLTGFYGSQPVKVEPVVETASPDRDVVESPETEDFAGGEPVQEESVAEDLVEPAAEEAEPEPSAALAVEPDHPVSVVLEGSLQNKLTQVRAKADEARMARLRANAALYEGLGAAYDFALDAEEAPEEYLRLVEAQGLKIQLRSPMKPVVKLAFAGMCDEPTIKQLEAVLAWAFEEELPRGTLVERIESAGGIGSILSQDKKAA